MAPYTTDRSFDYNSSLTRHNENCGVTKNRIMVLFVTNSLCPGTLFMGAGKPNTPTLCTFVKFAEKALNANAKERDTFREKDFFAQEYN